MDATLIVGEKFALNDSCVSKRESAIEATAVAGNKYG